MESKKRIELLGILIVLLLSGVALIVFLIDPFFHYHKPWFGLQAVPDIKEYQIPGILDNFDYDSVLVGSSVVVSINTDILNERFGCKTVKATANSAPAAQLNDYLDRAFSDHEIKYVFYGLDMFSLYTEPDMELYDEKLNYLVNENPFDDIKYLWNMDIFAEKVPYMIGRTRAGVGSMGTMYTINTWVETGADKVLDEYRPDLEITPVIKSEDYMMTEVMENMQRIEKHIIEHPKTEFMFMIPPYNILWWYRSYEQGTFENYMCSLEMCMNCLLRYDNVHIYATGFNNPQIIENMDKYTDCIHGDSSVTEGMALQIGTAENEITGDTYKIEIEKLRNLVYGFREKLEKEGLDFIYEGPWD